jgi:Domain of unknown function (DUF4184)
MPFTISHVAAVLPVRRWLRHGGLFSAAVIGSMAPDFGVLLPFDMSRGATHGVRALVAFCLPAGLLAWWLFQRLIRPAWAEVLPGGWRLRADASGREARPGDPRAWLAASAAILFGALTHLCWDAFTHEDGRGVRMLPFLDDYYGPELVGHPIHLYRWLQHGSSLLGLAAVASAAWLWTHDGQSRPARGQGAGDDGTRAGMTLGASERHYWLLAYLAVPALLLAGALLLGYPRRYPWSTLGDTVTNLAIIGLDGTGISLLLVSGLIHLRIRRAGTAPLDG